MRTSLLAAILGVSAHVFLFSRFEVDFFMLEILGLLSFAPIGLLFGYLWTDLPLVGALTGVASAFFGFSCGVFASIAVYRLFLHRLREFKGPFLARLTKFYAAHLSAKNVQYQKELDQLHQQYGDFIRTGPREICIVRKSAVRLVHGSESGCRKTTWYWQLTRNQTKTSIMGTRDHTLHGRRRRAWDKGLAIKVLPVYEPRVTPLVDLFLEQISTQGKPIDATYWSMLLGFDIMGKAAFGKHFGCLAEGRPHPAIRGMRESMEIVSTIGQVPWFSYMLSFLPMATATHQQFLRMLSNEVDEKLKNIDVDSPPQDVMSWILKAFIEKDISAPPSKYALHEDCRTMIVAGSETTSATLIAALFHLARNPTVLQKIRSQVDAVMQESKEWSYAKAKSITYLDDIINESMRLTSPVLVGGTRVTPPQGLHVDEQFIPGDINVIVPVQLLHTDARYWKQAHEFIPERFRERREELGTDDAPFFPFGVGPYSCAGKNLALMSLRIALFKVIQQLDFKFPPGENGSGFLAGWKDAFGATPPPVMIEFTKRSL